MLFVRLVCVVMRQKQKTTMGKTPKTENNQLKQQRNDKETINKKILNEKIGLLNNNMQNMIKIVEKKNKKLIAELKEHNTLLERFKSEQLTIQKYFIKEELKNKELEQVKQEQVKIIKDELNPNHIRFEYV
jgi:FMN-dependent NADH-azoreductase